MEKENENLGTERCENIDSLYIRSILYKPFNNTFYGCEAWTIRETEKIRRKAN